ncbi:hypothetical protein HYV31_01100 [candidate division WWE3 bacterium]|nr:hypothetical protein [candidate division WWE3 bacterium]
MYLIDVKKLYFYSVSFFSLLALAFSLFGGVSNIARFYLFKTGPLVSYQPPFISTWVTWSSLSTGMYQNYPVAVEVDPYNLKMEAESLKIAAFLTSYSDVDPTIKEQLNMWSDTYASWKNEQLNVKKSITDNIVTNITAFLIFLPIFLFHLIQALNLDKSSKFVSNQNCVCGGNCGCNNHEVEFCGDSCECKGTCMCGLCDKTECKCECHKG